MRDSALDVSSPSPIAPRALRGAMVALAAAAGSVVGIRSLLALELPRLAVLVHLPSPPSERLGLAWSRYVQWPAELQAEAGHRLVGLAAALLLGTVVVATLNALVSLTEAAVSRRREFAIRAAVGAGPASLVTRMGSDVRPWISSGIALGLVLGLALGGVLRASWPGPIPDGLTSWAGLDLLLALVLLTGGAVTAYVGWGWIAGRGSRLADGLRAGGRASDDRAAIVVRRSLAAFQMAVAGTVIVASLALLVAVPGGPPAVDDGTDGTVVLDVRSRPGVPEWASLRASLAGIAGLEAESLAAPGAVLGLGPRDYALSQCGDCYRGGLPVPLWTALADHLAVAPGFFGLAGVPLVAGRSFDARDGPAAPRVAVVNRTFANAAFDRGEAVGRGVRLGTGMDAWYTVVGIVEDIRWPVPGAPARPLGMVYVSALQHPLTQGTWLLRGSPKALADAQSLLTTAGVAEGERRALETARSGAAQPLRWARGVALGAGLLTLILSVVGTALTARQIARRASHAYAVRRALGASDSRILRHALGGSARAGLWGGAGAVLGGTAAVAVLQESAAGLAGPGPLAYALVVGLLVLVATTASLGAARSALGVEPAQVME